MVALEEELELVPRRELKDVFFTWLKPLKREVSLGGRKKLFFFLTDLEKLEKTAHFSLPRKKEEKIIIMTTSLITLSVSPD